MLTLLFTTFCFFFVTTFGINVKNQEATQEWWVAFFLENVNIGCGSISNVEVRDSGSYSNWYGFTNYEHNYYSFNNNGNRFQLPLDVRITNSAGTKLVLNDIITTFNGNQIFSSSVNFCTGPTPKPTTPPPTASTTPSPTSSSGSMTCVGASASNFNWKANNYKILLNGKEFKMKGASWFGFETDTYIVHGLASWASGGRGYKEYLNFLVNNNFNAIRLPFSQWVIQNNPIVPSQQYNAGGNSDFNGKRALQAMDIIIREAGKRGLLIMLDYHCVNRNSYTDGFKIVNQNTARNIWKQLADRYKNDWNVFMIDIYNEPHDVSNPEWNTLWKPFCQNVGNDLLNKNVNWLFAVQGTNWQCTNGNCYWGENLQGVKNNPVILNKKNRVVYSPHVYGFNANNAYSASIWNSHFGYIAKGSIVKSGQTIKAPVVVGEYGTKYSTNSEKTWLNTFISYLKNNLKQKNTFFWCLNANSGDTGGLLKNDWRTAETAKLNKLKELQPNPTKFVYQSNGNKVCWNDGSGGSSNAEANNAQNADNLEHFSLSQDTKDYDWSEWTVLTIILLICVFIMLCICFVLLVLVAKKFLIKSNNETAQKIGNAAIRYSVVVQRRFTINKIEDDNNSNINNNNININNKDNDKTDMITDGNNTTKDNAIVSPQTPPVSQQTNIVSKDSSDEE